MLLRHRRHRAWRRGKAAGLKYHIGLDSHKDTGEPQALDEARNIVQDMTYVMTLQFHKTPQTIARPDGYDPLEFRNCCINPLNDSTAQQKPWNQHMMMTYGRLPNGKYIINWPMSGNDFYINDVDLTPAQRVEVEKQAKAKSLRFLYFMQTELGMDTLGMADEYPTTDDRSRGNAPVRHHRRRTHQAGRLRRARRPNAAPIRRARRRPLGQLEIKLGKN